MKKAKDILEGKISGSRPVGEPKDTWIDTVTGDVRKLVKICIRPENLGERY
jgi:hypothetical protein